MQTAKGLPEAGGTLVKDQHDATISGQLAHFVQEVILRPHVAHHLHLDHANIVAIDQGFQLGVVVVVEGEHGAPEVTRHTIGFEPRQQMTSQVLVVA